DEIEHGHGHLLARPKRLFGETEALNLVEVFSRLLGLDIETRCARYRLRREVLRLVDRHVALADLNGVGHLSRTKFPRQVGGGVRIEPDRDRWCARAVR